MSRTGKALIDGYKHLAYAKRNWQLLDDREPFKTNSGLLQPVIYKGTKAMLKIPASIEESRGFSLMAAWNGNGCAQVFKYDDNALLMERAIGTISLKEMVLQGNEDEANSIICDVAAKLHAATYQQFPQLVPLPTWFNALKSAAHNYGGLFITCNEVADSLLNAPVDTTVLHGDIHYDNILDSGTRGWIAIDPKGLAGERAFDFANIFCNPDFAIAAAPLRLPKQVKLIAARANLEPKRLLKWIIAWAGLSATFSLEDSDDPKLQLTAAQIALNELNNF
jgi:streptomycin 6-kinase